MGSEISMWAVGQQVADALGPDYHVNKYKNFDDIVVLRKDGEDPEWGIVLTHAPRKSQITISGSSPTATDKKVFLTQEETINVGQDRTGEQITRAINQRFLSAYIVRFGDAVIERDRHNRYLDKQNKLMDKFVKILHGQKKDVDKIDGGPRTFEGRGYLRGGMYVNATDNTVRMEFESIPTEIAERILAIWLEGWIPKCRRCRGPVDKNDCCTDRECTNFGKHSA